ncbi:MAG TPA: isoaspartyl peptidase/L-asparaginase [Nitrososphaeraceae archaeon]
MAKKNFGILIHGGASGSNKRRITKQSFNRGEGRIAKAIEQAVCCGFDILRNVNANESSTALDAVEIAVTSMENSGVFDAGIVGSYLTMDSEIEMDASIMNGKDLTAGSVGAVKNIQNPIKLARLVMERTDHVMVVSDGATQLAKLFGIEIKYRKPSEQNLKKYNNYIRNNKNKRAMKSEWPKNYKLFSSLSRFMCDHFGTVGAVAIDKQGNVASAVSTGGRWFKMRGRVGDSAIIGSGLYADNESGAACTTGVGELIIRLCLAKTACDYMRAEQDALTSSRRAIELLTRKFGKNTGGIIAVNKHGEFGMEINTQSMPIALFTNKTGDRPKVALSKHEAASLFI